MSEHLSDFHAGIVMVKPHAYEEILTPVIKQMLQGEALADNLDINDPLRKVTDSLSVGSIVIRDLSVVPYGEDLIGLFYKNKETRRYYPMIREYYVGQAAFLPYVYSGAVDDLPSLYSAIKGRTTTYDASGMEVDQASGVRGLLGKPYEFISREDSLSLDEEEYRRLFTPVVNNYIHVTDSLAETAQAIAMIGMGVELREAYHIAGMGVDGN